MIVKRNDATDALRDAHYMARQLELTAYGVAWFDPTPLDCGGWSAYDLRQGCPTNAEPEFFCIPGKVPMPLNSRASEVLLSVLRHQAYKVDA